MTSKLLIYCRKSYQFALTVTGEGTVASQAFCMMLRMTYIFTFNKFNNSSSFLHSTSWTK